MSNIPLLFFIPLLISSCVQPDNQSDSYVATIDSLKSENSRLRNQLTTMESRNSITLNTKEDEIKIDTLTGYFTESWRGDCFHLNFKTSDGSLIEFNNPNNSVGYDIFDYSGELKLKKDIKEKKFKIWFATLKAIECKGADSYDPEKEKKFVDMPTILKTEQREKQ